MGETASVAAAEENKEQNQSEHRSSEASPFASSLEKVLSAAVQVGYGARNY
jgi:hypothetical protein